jgi:hypothetical protein
MMAASVATVAALLAAQMLSGASVLSNGSNGGIMPQEHQWRAQVRADVAI